VTAEALLAERVPLGASGIEVSRLGFGTIGLGTPHVREDRTEVERMIARYLDCGGNFFDTADSYNAGWSEAVLGGVLRGRRDRVVIASKVGMPVGHGDTDFGLSPAHIARSIDGTLRRLRTDYVDLYQVHFFDDRAPLEQTLTALAALVDAGKVRAIGASSFHGWQLVRAIETSRRLGIPRFQTVQLKYNLVRRDIEHELLALCTELDVAVLTFSPLHGGVLAGALSSGAEPPTRSRLRSPHMRRIYLGDRPDRVLAIADGVRRIAESLSAPVCAVALAWLLHRPGVASVLIGPESNDELRDDLRALQLRLEDSALRSLDELSAPPPMYPDDFYTDLPATHAEMRAHLEPGPELA
jgi:aryl-alcohol dehydrogenase-like predicted oxidoreductase